MKAKDSLKDKTPGPDAYSPEKSNKNGPAFTVSVGNDPKIKKKVPGPGAYEYRSDFNDSPKRSNAGFGSNAGRNDVKKSDAPGPGAYRVFHKKLYYVI